MTSLRRRFDAVGEAFAAAFELADGMARGTVERDGATQPVHARLESLGDGRVRIHLDGKTHLATVIRQGNTTWVSAEGRTYEFQDRGDEGAPAGSAARDRLVRSPMTGTLVRIDVAANQQVVAGAPLFLVEAMKMEYVVRAPHDAVVARVLAVAGATISIGAPVVELDAPAGDEAP